MFAMNLIPVTLMAGLFHFSSNTHGWVIPFQFKHMHLTGDLFGILPNSVRM